MGFSVYCFDEQFLVLPVHERVHTPDEFVAIQDGKDIVPILAFASGRVNFDGVVEIEDKLGSCPIAKQVVER